MLQQYRVMAACNRQMIQQFYAACARLIAVKPDQDRNVFLPRAADTAALAAEQGL